MQTLRCPFADQQDTALLAGRLGTKVRPGDFLALFGDLGAGKTTFLRALADKLDIHDLASPTFTIVQEHMGTLPLFHFDAYRLSDADELFAIGFADYLARDGVIAMEWCENVPDALPASRLEIHIIGSGEDPRDIRLLAYGTRYETLLEEMCLCCS